MAGRLQQAAWSPAALGRPGWGTMAISVLFAREGARVFGIDASRRRRRDASDHRGRGRRLPDPDRRCHRRTTGGAAVAACLDDFGRLDILNNVGIARVGGSAEFEETAWDEVMRVNVKSAYLTCRHVLPVMERQGGVPSSTTPRSPPGAGAA